jgi:hypothetical protein
MVIMLGWLTGSSSSAQTYVTPKMGGAQVAADMVHIDVYYDADANQLHASVDTSYGTPELRALAPGDVFDPQAPYAVLNGKAYNAQYGWNAGGFFTIPPGAAIWIEQTNAPPGLEVYQGWGQFGNYTPILGTSGSSRLWKWSGVMVHNTYAVHRPARARYVADYHIYFGDATTGSRQGFTQYDDAFVCLEWTVVPVEDPRTFRFGAASSSGGSPLCFLNAGGIVTNSEFVLNLTNSATQPESFTCGFPLLAVPATAANGGPATNHAALGSCLELELVSLAGPTDAILNLWQATPAQAQVSIAVGQGGATNRLRISQNNAVPGTDPFGQLAECRAGVSAAGLYCLGFRLVDVSANGPDGTPLHTPSEVYTVYLQAGLTLASLSRTPRQVVAAFGGEPGRTFYLERSSTLGDAGSWQPVAGPLSGTNRIQWLADGMPPNDHAFYRLRCTSP